MKLSYWIDRFKDRMPDRSAAPCYGCDRLTVAIGGVLVEITAGHALGRPALELRSLGGTVAVAPIVANSIAVVAFNDGEASLHAAEDRQAAEEGRE